MTRHQPQIQTTEEGAGMARRRSARLHPQIQASEQSAGVTCRRSPRLHPQTQEIRRSPRLHPQIEAGKDGAGVTRRIRRRRGGASPASLPNDDDMLREILIRLPPQPSSLPRASAVCKRWRGLVTEPKFHRQFYAHHRNPPILGVFERNFQGILFTPVLDPPNRIPPQRFNLGCSSRDYDLLDCRHGLVLAKDRMRNEVFVYDPITREQRRVAVPLEFKRDYYYLTGAVVCPAGNQDHMHGGCHLSPFKVVLVSMHREDNQTLACVYCSETGKWDNLISTEVPCAINDFGTPATLVGNVLHWLFNSDRILEFDLDGQNQTSW
uniref:Uncharacterized protein n=3 Tax=Avena sativa TaxID=4498 RepID=A0ACD5TSE9_AVESA